MSYWWRPGYLGCGLSGDNPMTSWMGYPADSWGTYFQPTVSLPGSDYGSYTPTPHDQGSWIQPHQQHSWSQAIPYFPVYPISPPGQPETRPSTPSSQPAHFHSTNASGSQSSLSPIAIASPPDSSSPSAPPTQASYPMSTASTSAVSEGPSASNPSPVGQPSSGPSPPAPLPIAQSTAVETASPPPTTQSNAESTAAQSASGVAVPPVSVPSTPPVSTFDRPDENKSETQSETPAPTSSTVLSDDALRNLLQRLMKQGETNESIISSSAEGEHTHTHDTGLAAAPTSLQPQTPLFIPSEHTSAIHSNFESHTRGRRPHLVPLRTRRHPSVHDEERFYGEEYNPRQPEVDHARETNMGWSQDLYRSANTVSEEDEWNGEAIRSGLASSTNIVSELGSIASNSAKLLARGASWIGNDILRPALKGISSVLSDGVSAASDALDSFEEYAAEAELPPAPQLTKRNLRKMNKGAKKRGLFTRSDRRATSGSGGSRTSKGSALSSVFSRKRGDNEDQNTVTSWESDTNAKLTRKQRKALKKRRKAAERENS